MSGGCPYAHEFQGRPWASPWKDRALHAAIPLVRGYTRYGPYVRGRQKLWRRVVRPYFAWHSHRFVARTAFGARMAGDTREVLQQHVYYFGVWEPNLTRWIGDRLRPGDTFVDVGANIGYFTLLASKLVGPGGRVVAIEALGETFARLEENLARNRCANVRALNVAAAESEGVLRAYQGPESHTGLATVVEDFGHRLEGEVAAAPLDSLLSDAEIASARMIKVDVEGSELGVARGLAAALDRARPDLEVVVELHPWPLGHLGHSASDVIDVMAASGFHPYALEIDYEPAHALAGGRPQRAVRLEEAPDLELDVVFSREDRDAI